MWSQPPARSKSSGDRSPLRCQGAAQARRGRNRLGAPRYGPPARRARADRPHFAGAVTIARFDSVGRPGAIAAAPLCGLLPIPASAAVEVDEDQAAEGIPPTPNRPRRPAGVKTATRRRADGLRPLLTPTGHRRSRHLSGDAEGEEPSRSGRLQDVALPAAGQRVDVDGGSERLADFECLAVLRHRMFGVLTVVEPQQPNHD